MKKFFLFVLFALVAVLDAGAQWSEDPSVNLRVTPNNVSFYDPSVATNSDGVTYILFIVPGTNDAGDDIFQFRLQIIDADGKRVFGAPGKIVSKERNFTWTKFNEYLLVDADGNAIVSIPDLRNAELRPNEQGQMVYADFTFSVYKFSPTGEQLWGPVILNNGEPDERALGMYMCCTDDGGYAFAYTSSNQYGNDYSVRLERLDKDGNPLWDSPVLVDPNTTSSYPFVVNNTDNQVMVAYRDRVEGQFLARVFDQDGNDVWGEAVPIYTGGFSSDRIYPSLRVKPGPDGGMLFAVMDGGWVGRFVYLTKDGQYAFPNDADGVDVPGNSYYSAVPDVYYDAGDDAFYVSFVNYDLYYGGEGINLQKFSLQGERQWGEDGVSVIPTETNQEFQNALVRPDGKGNLAVFYQHRQTGSNLNPVGSLVTVVDKQCNLITDSIDFATSNTIKNDFCVSQLISGNHFIASWTEQRSNSTSACVFLQYVAADGSTSQVEVPLAASDDDTTQAVYDLQGRRVTGNAKPGIYIVRRGDTSQRVLIR